MKLDANTQARAATLRNRIDSLSDNVLRQDGQPADLDKQPDSVLLGSEPAVIYPADNGYQEQIVSAKVSGDGNGGTRGAELETIQYYNSSYGRSAESGYEMSKQQLDGSTVYKQRYYDPMGVRNSKTEARFSPSGELVAFKEKKFAATWPEAIKEVATSPVAWGLIAFAGALGGCPGTLGYALAGSAWPGVVTAGATAAGLAYYKTRAWD